jgi:short-subunit dehydrogenase
MHLTRTLLPHLRNHPSSIINVSSGGGLYGLPNASMYCASKFAVEGWTESLHHELKPFQVYVKLVIPYGGVSGTAFGQNAMSNMPKADISSNDVAVERVYAPVVQKMGEKLRGIAAGGSVSSEQVAEKILEAVEDGKVNKLRYFIGNDSSGFLKARLESQNDDDYMAYMSDYFAL